MERIWHKSYPSGVPAEIETGGETTLVTVIEESFRRSPETSLEFVSNPSDQRAQRDVYWRYLRGWMRRDETAARQWMDRNAQSLPPQIVERFNRPRQ